VFFIVEKPHYPQFFDEWWNRVTVGVKVENEYKISDSIKLLQGRYYTDDELELIEELPAMEATASAKAIKELQKIKKQLGVDKEKKVSFDEEKAAEKDEVKKE
jgi:hypothetical protein